MKRRLLFLILSVCFLGNAQSGFGEPQIIESGLSSFWTIAADVNGDNYQDILIASIGTSTIAWYQNIDGMGNFSTQHIITDNLTDTHRVNVADIDNDGDLDVLGLSFGDDLAVWYENLDGNGNFSSQKIISNTQDLPNTIIGADIDGDGDKDIVICSRLDNTIAWYENIGGQGVWSSQQIISNTALTAIGMAVTDIDNDGDMDIVSDSSSNQNPAWYRNMNGEGLFGGEHIITSENSGTIFVGTADLDGDNDQDIISLEFGGTTIAWFENLNGFGTFGSKQIITTAINAPYMFRTGDIDNDGDIDLASVSAGDNKLAWYKNDGLGNFSSQIIIDDNFINGRAIFFSDFDGDGYLDLVASNVDPNTKRLVWYRNQTYLGIEENPLQTTTLTPNPTSGILQLNNVQTAVKKIAIYDVLGKPVLQQNGDNKTIDLSSLQQGLYLINIETAKGSTVKKVVKQ